jgi:hypothetical protein
MPSAAAAAADRFNNDLRDVVIRVPPVARRLRRHFFSLVVEYL